MYLFVTISLFITNILSTITSVVPQFPKVKGNALSRNSYVNYLPLLKKSGNFNLKRNNKETLIYSKYSIENRQNFNLSFTRGYIFSGHTVVTDILYKYSILT